MRGNHDEVYHLLPQDKDIIEPECEEGKEEKKGKHQTANCLLSSLVVVMNRMKLIADIYISISTETFDIENIKYEKKLAIVRFRYIL